MKAGLKAILKVSTITQWMVWGGLIFILLSNINYGIEIDYAWVVVLKSIVESIATTVFSAGVVSVVLEVSTITQIVKDALFSFLDGKIPFKTLSITRLEEINKQVALHRLSNEKLKESDVEDSPYTMEPELLELSKGLYYEYHKARFIIEPDDKQEVFHKKVEFEYKIINRLGIDNKAKFTVSLICKKDNLTIDQLRSNFKITMFKIEESDKKSMSGKHVNVMDLTENASEYLKFLPIGAHAHSMYLYEVHFEYQLTNKIAHKIKIGYEYSIPQSDITQSYKLNYPSKVLEHEILISGNGWEVTGDAFTAFYFPGIYDKEYTVSQILPTSIRVDFRDWSVPGAGYIATYLKK